MQYFFQDSLINKKLKKHSIYLKYNFFIIIVLKKLVFIQQRFAKLIETEHHRRNNTMFSIHLTN